MYFLHWYRWLWPESLFIPNINDFYIKEIDFSLKNWLVFWSKNVSVYYLKKMFTCVQILYLLIQMSPCKPLFNIVTPLSISDSTCRITIWLSPSFIQYFLPPSFTFRLSGVHFHISWLIHHMFFLLPWPQ